MLVVGRRIVTAGPHCEVKHLSMANLNGGARCTQKQPSDAQKIKKKKALEPGASSAHSIRDIRMHSPHAYPGHSTCHVLLIFFFCRLLKQFRVFFFSFQGVFTNSVTSAMGSWIRPFWSSGECPAKVCLGRVLGCLGSAPGCLGRMPGCPVDC